MEPRLSVVVAGSRPEGPPEALYRGLRPLLRAGSVELLIATARPAALAAEPGTRIVVCPPGSTVPALRLAGVRAATAPLIALTEDFCAPAEGWAQSLLEARGRVHAAVLGGPVARRGGSASDWALTLMEYGRFFRREPEGEVPDLPSINAAYPADLLRDALRDETEGVFEVQLHAWLRERGKRFWRVPGAVMYDENVVSLAHATRAQYHHGRVFGGGRVQGSGPFPRLFRGALAAAVPAVLLGRIAREAAAAGHAPDILRSLPALSLLLCAWAAGEAIGSLFGPGRSGERWT